MLHLIVDGKIMGKRGPVPWPWILRQWMGLASIPDKVGCKGQQCSKRTRHMKKKIIEIEYIIVVFSISPMCMLQTRLNSFI